MSLDALFSLVGDTPVCDQISEAIKNHDHEDCAKRTEVEELKRKIEMLFSLIGDTSVSEQIEMAIKNIK